MHFKIIDIKLILKRCLLLLAVFFILPIPSSNAYSAETNRYSEYEVKAAFIYNFAKFVRWPDGSFTPDKKIINLCVIGSGFPADAFDLIEGKPVHERILLRKKISSLTDVKMCNMLFICSSERHMITQIVNITRGLPILTVGDTEGFAEKGVMINLYLEENRVRFEVNVGAARKAGLNISSQLLRLARIVQENK